MKAGEIDEVSCRTRANALSKLEGGHQKHHATLLGRVLIRQMADRADFFSSTSLQRGSPASLADPS